MGVPAFFRWLSRKYPSIVVEVREENAVYVNGVKVYADASKPNPNGIEFDNLYLDMNGIIHPCTHPEDRPPPQTEAEMMLAIFDYLDRLFAIVRPRKLVYMAVDGVAPRAKMNQQRSRRFRAAKESIDKEIELSKLRSEKLSEGVTLPPPQDPSMKFDSNCITPGTEFMSRLTEWLVFYVHQRMAENPAWRDLVVLLSDASVPGEGEHKIMDFIRRQRATPDYDANMAHCLCGADADLIMLGLATHEPNFTIIREEFVPNKPRPCELCAQFGHETKQCTGMSRSADDGKNEQPNSESQQAENVASSSTSFIYIRLNVLREYLERELELPSSSLRFEYSFERILDDFVFLCFFVGNDFLPHLPSLEIREGAIDRLVRIYKEILPTCDGYLTRDGQVQIERVEPLLRLLGEQEDAIFQKRRSDELHQRRRERERKDRESNSYWNRVAREDPSIALPAFIRDGPSPRRGAGQPGFDRFSHEYLGRDRSRDRNQDANESQSPSRADSSTNNYDAASQLRQQLGGGSRKRPSDSAASEEPDSKVASTGTEEQQARTPVVQEQEKKEKEKEEEDLDELDSIRLWESGWKERYYMNKFEVDARAQPDFPKIVAREYARGLCWVLLYYYQGVPSWKWYYPFHYAPFASDFAGMRPAGRGSQNDGEDGMSTNEKDDALAVVTSFENNTRPFKPLEQLMGVFPAASRRFLPPSWQRLMTEEDSPVIDLYPCDFRVDLNGKRYAWQGVAVLPFVDEARLLGAIEPFQQDLTEEEEYRNREGDDIIFISKMHPGFSMLHSLYEVDQQPQVTELAIDPKLFSGFSGIARRWPKAYPIELPIRFDREGYSDLIKRNVSIAVLYCSPTYPPGFLFPAKMLDHASAAPRTLKPSDFESLRNNVFDSGPNRRFQRGGGPRFNSGRGFNNDWRPNMGFGPSDRPATDPRVAQRMITHAQRGWHQRPHHYGGSDEYVARPRYPHRGGHHYQSHFNAPHQQSQDYDYDQRQAPYNDHHSRYDGPHHGGSGYSRNESAPPRRDHGRYRFDGPPRPHAPPYAPYDHRFGNAAQSGGAPPPPLAWGRMQQANNAAYGNESGYSNNYQPPRPPPPSFVPNYRRY